MTSGLICFRASSFPLFCSFFEAVAIDSSAECQCVFLCVYALVSCMFFFFLIDVVYRELSIHAAWMLDFKVLVPGSIYNYRSSGRWASTLVKAFVVETFVSKWMMSQHGWTLRLNSQLQHVTVESSPILHLMGVLNTPTVCNYSLCRSTILYRSVCCMDSSLLGCFLSQRCCKCLHQIKLPPLPLANSLHDLFVGFGTLARSQRV